MQESRHEAAQRAELPATTVVARFQIGCLRYLDQAGDALQPLPQFAAGPETLTRMYQALVLARAFDAKAIALQRTGKIGTYAAALGQEAVGVGTAFAMGAEDVLFPSYRESAAMLVRGVTMEELLLYWAGDERGSNFSGPRADFPICVPVASQAPHAAGAAYAFKLRGERRVAVCVLGDGATSKGDFYEAINFAGVHALPVVFVINNNGWAISVPLRLQTAAQTLAQKAIAAGVEGLQVDGNDVIAVRDAVERAAAKARSGGGPTLIEALTYRLGDHTTADDATRYRDPEEVKAQWRFEPIARLRAYLSGRGWWDKEREEALHGQCAERIQKALDAFEAMPPPGPEAMFDHLYASLPKALEAQRARAIEEHRRRG